MIYFTDDEIDFGYEFKENSEFDYSKLHIEPTWKSDKHRPLEVTKHPKQGRL